MKISILTPDFSHNCFGRAWLLAKLLQPNFDIEVIGPAFGDGIWKPMKDECDFPVKMVVGHPNGRFEFRKMLSLISGDVIYASKPLMPSFGVGLVKKSLTRKPLVLDIDDWELGFGKEFYDSLIWPKKINDFLLSLKNPKAYYYIMILDKLNMLADDITVSGRILQKRYGGTIIWHGRNADIFNPERFNSQELKQRHLGITDSNKFIISYIGSPSPHKGIDDLIDAFSLLDDDNCLLMIVGMDDCLYCNSLVRRIQIKGQKNRTILFSQQPFNLLPEFLAISDLVVIPQRKRPASDGQVPAKIFDAMAMAKPIISTDLTDIREILKGCGWITSSENPVQLKNKIQYALSHFDETIDFGLKAREKFKNEYSHKIIKKKLVSIFKKYENKDRDSKKILKH